MNTVASAFNEISAWGGGLGVGFAIALTVVLGAFLAKRLLGGGGSGGSSDCVVPTAISSRLDALPVVVISTGSNTFGAEVVQQFLQHRSKFLLVIAAKDKKWFDDLRAQVPGAAQDESVSCHPLDIQSTGSVQAFAAFMRHRYGRVDVLVSSMQIYAPEQCHDTVSGSEKILGANYFGAAGLSAAMDPLLQDARDGGPGCVLHVSSRRGGRKAVGGSAFLQREFATPLSTTELSRLVKAFFDALALGSAKEAGWPKDPYDLSMVALVALARAETVERTPAAAAKLKAELGRHAPPPRATNVRTVAVYAEGGAAAVVSLAKEPSKLEAGGLYDGTSAVKW